MIIERSMHPEWLSNAYLVVDEPGGAAVVIDSGGPSGPLLDKIEETDVTATRPLLTHHHVDHVAENTSTRSGSEWGSSRTRWRPSGCTMWIARSRPGTTVLEVGGLSIDALHTPGHTDGMLNFVVNRSDVFTADTLFKDSVGGVRAPGSTSFEDLAARSWIC